MNLRLLCGLLVLCSTTWVGCSKKETPQPATPSPPASAVKPAEATPPTAADLAALASGLNTLSVELYRAARPAQGNLALSPASISSALALTWAGAEKETAEEMKRVLHFPLPARELLEAHGALLQLPGGKCELASANGLWVDPSLALRPEFEQLLGSSARAALQRVDFSKDAAAARARINQWVSEQTKSRIPELLPADSLDERTRLVLANALYFKGRWKEAFKAAETQPSAFILPSEEVVQVPTMRRRGTYRTARPGPVRLLELEYECSEVSLLILLPEQKTDEGQLTAAQALARLEESLSAQALEQWTSQLAPETLSVALPRFKVQGPIALTQVLQQVGLKRAFSDQAEFGGMSASEPLKLEEAFHQSYVQVDEEGTEAAAATAVEVVTRSAPAQDSYFVVDRPFLFALRHRGTGALLLLGRVVDPR